MKKDTRPAAGLKSMRPQGDKPAYTCSNCKCVRYAPCGCRKRQSR